jgi:carboxylesterase type B
MVRGAGERAGQLNSIMEEMHRAIARFLFADAPSESSWPNYDTSDRSTFIYDVASTLREDPDEELREVWSSLIE